MKVGPLLHLWGFLCLGLVVGLHSLGVYQVSDSDSQLLISSEEGASCCHKTSLVNEDFISHPPPRWNVRSTSEHRGPINHDTVNKTLLPLVFEPLPLGSIKPRGWFRQQLQLMADGLPGHLHDFYRIVRNATWLGGTEEYSFLNEAWPYYINGIVPLAFGLDDERLKKEVRSQISWVLDSQYEDGWLGPETQVSRRNFWGRYPFFLALAQLAEAENPDESARILRAMHRFVDLMYDMLKNDYQGYVWKDGDEFDEQWGRSRAADMIMSLQWLYERHPANNTEKIHESMLMMYEMAFDWSYWFSEGVFLKEDLDTLPIQLTDAMFPYVHGVNAGQGLKSTAVMRRLVHDHALLNSTRRGVDWTFRYHGTPSGAIIGDERESGLSPVRGTELCSVVETMFSLTHLYQSVGDREFADRFELAAFNALPVMVTSEWWAHQYIAQTNQPISHPLRDQPFWNVGPFGQTFGTEPNYPCCTVDFSQGYPKLLSNSFVRTGNIGLAHAILIPSEVNATLEKDNNIHIICETEYPFNHTLSYRIAAQKAFKFSVRVPSWVDLGSSYFSTDRQPPNHDQRLSLQSPISQADRHLSSFRLDPDPATGMHRILVLPGETNIKVHFDTAIRIEHRANETISIHHGALLYALSIKGIYTTHRPGRYPDDTAPPEASDWTILPREGETWNIAIDPATVEFNTSSSYGPSSHEFSGEVEDDVTDNDLQVDLKNKTHKSHQKTNLPTLIWDEFAPPVSITVMACEIDWNLTYPLHRPSATSSSSSSSSSPTSSSPSTTSARIKKTRTRTGKLPHVSTDATYEDVHEKDNNEHEHGYEQKFENKHEREERVVANSDSDEDSGGGYLPNPPLPGLGRRNCTGPPFRVVLKPYGSAKLHIAEFPVVDLQHE